MNMKWSLPAIVLACAALVAPVAGASRYTTVGAIVPVEDAQRVVYYAFNRHHYTTDGVILVCPPDAKPSRQEANECELPNKPNAWVPLYAIDIPGYTVSGIQYVIGAQWRTLTVYYRKR